MSESRTSAKTIHRALLSVTDKTGLVEFARALAGLGVELISTGGTARALREAGLAVKDISDLTGFPEMLDGRVKTLHPLVHGGLLYIRGNAEHEAAVAAHGIQPIDMVVVNLYAFEKTAAQPGMAFGHLIENIDIGGPSMVRSAAKNFEDVAIVTRVEDYPALTEELRANAGGLTRATRWRLAKQAFATTAAYDTAIANTLDRIAEAPAPIAAAEPDMNALPTTLRINLPMAQSLRYGENPHQRAALYADGSGLGVAGATQLQGKELSFNNLVDLDACWELAQEFEETAVIIVKHTNPCGAATGATVLEAYQKALAADPVSAFGGVIGINREVDADAAVEIAKLFVEAIAAPGFTVEARERFAAKKNLRLVGPTHWHITLRFLGEVTEAELETLGGALRAAAAALPGPAECRLGPATAWFSRVRVLQLPAQGLGDVAAAVRRVLAESSFAARARTLQSEIAQSRPLDTITEVLLEVAVARTGG